MHNFEEAERQKRGMRKKENLEREENDRRKRSASEKTRENACKNEEIIEICKFSLPRVARAKDQKREGHQRGRRKGLKCS